MDEHFLKEVAEILAVDLDEQTKAEQRVDQLHVQTDHLLDDSTTLLANTDDLLATNDWDALGTGASMTQLDDLMDILKDSAIPLSKPLDHLDSIESTGDWTTQLHAAEQYAKQHELDLKNPYLAAMSHVEFAAFSTAMMEKYQITTLDKYDYIYSAVVGIIMGLVDAFLVGSITDGNNPTTKAEQGILGKKVDAVYDNVVKKFAVDKKLRQINASTTMSAQRKAVLSNQIKHWDTKHAIGFLEKEFKVTYDASSNASVIVGSVAGMNPANHHLLSLAHDPGPMGLVFGIIDQLSGKTTMIDATGKLIRVVTKNKSSMVQGGNSVQQIIHATTNWFGHTMSDIAGSSTAKVRGAGLPAPFYSLTQKLQFGHFNINASHQDMTMAQVAEWLYKQGLDTRAVTAQAIPVLVAEILVRLYWLFKRRFYYGMSWKESLPLAKNLDLSKMLTMSMATFETVDIADAMLRNGTTPLALLRINYVGIFDLGFRALQTTRNQLKHIHQVNELVDHDIQAEWNRVLA